MFDINSQMLSPIYTWVRFRIRLAHFPKYKNNYNLKNGLAYCEIALRNRTSKQAFTYTFFPSLTVAAVDALQTLFRVHPRGPKHSL